MDEAWIVTCVRPDGTEETLSQPLALGLSVRLLQDCTALHCAALHVAEPVYSGAGCQLTAVVGETKFYLKLAD